LHGRFTRSKLLVNECLLCLKNQSSFVKLRHIWHGLSLPAFGYKFDRGHKRQDHLLLHLNDVLPDHEDRAPEFSPDGEHVPRVLLALLVVLALEDEVEIDRPLVDLRQ